MPTLNFPPSPTDGQVYTENGKTWVYSTANTCWNNNTSPASVASSINATDDNSTNASFYPVCVGAAGNSQTPKISTTTFSYNPSTQILSFTGQIRSTGDIVAFYSDERLKNLLGPISNPLQRVQALTGYFFTPNDLAKALGYNDESVQVGVSAQEVQAVLPEVVVSAPVGEDYLTVKYEKLVPLLIEAIKEQQKQIDELKSMVLKNG